MAQIEGRIRFDNNPYNIFYTGSTINGEFQIVLTKPIDIHGIKLIINGKANVFLSDMKLDSDSKTNSTEITRYMAKDDYFETLTYLYGSADESNQLNEGSHCYKFSYNLPSKLPSSMEGHFGRVRYYAKAIIEFSTVNKPVEVFTSYFTVLQITDLNYDQPMIRLPCISEINEQFLCWPCCSNSLTFQARIPQSGYVCGQLIPITINITNKGGKFIHEIFTSLHLIMKYQSEFPRYNCKNEEFIIKKIHTYLNTKSIKETLHINLPVPPTPPSCSEKLCRIIQVSYELRTRMFVKNIDANLMISHPIVIGNIPLRRLYSNSISKLNSNAYAPKNVETFAKDIGLDPPIYEEAFYMKSKKLPRYPVYSFNPQISRVSSYISHI